MRIANETMILAPADLSVDFTSEPVYLGHIAQYAIQAVHTGATDGTFQLECSNDPAHPNAQARAMQGSDIEHWTPITGSAQVVTEEGTIVWNAEEVGYLWVRVTFTSNAGAATLTSCRINCKGI